jgi:hypothetical protein
MNRNDVRSAQMGSHGLPARRGRRPKTVRGPLHIQCNGHGDLKYLNQLVDEVLTWPHIEPAEPFISRSNTIPIRLIEMAAYLPLLATCTYHRTYEVNQNRIRLRSAIQPNIKRGGDRRNVQMRSVLH